MIKKSLIVICATVITILSLAGCSWFSPANPTPKPGQPGSANGTNSVNQQPTPIVVQSSPLPGSTVPPANMMGWWRPRTYCARPPTP